MTGPATPGNGDRRPHFLRLLNGSYVKLDRLGYAGIRLREPDSVWEIYVAEARGREATRHVVEEALSQEVATIALGELMARIAQVVA